MRPTDALPHPPDWTTRTVAEAVTVRRGVSWDKNQERDQPRDYTVPVIRVGNVQETLELDDLLHLAGVTATEMAATRVTAGWSIMVGSNGNRRRVGNAVLVRDDADYLFASFLVAARPRPGSGITPEYFFRWLTTEPVQSYLTASAEGTTGLSNLSRSFFRQMSIAFPDEDEQQAMIRTLGGVDDLLAAARAAAAERAAFKRALTARLLRTGTEGEAQRKSLIGSVPATWEVVPLRELIHTFQYGLSVPMSTAGELPILRMGNIQNGEVVLDDLKYVSLPKAATAPYLLRRGDVLFNRTNSQELVGKSAVCRSDQEAVFASYLIRLVPRAGRVDPYFLGHLLDSYATQCRIKRYATPGVQQVNINASNLARVLVPCPPPDEQRRIARVLEAAHASVRAYESMLASIKQLRRSLARDLMTGAVRTAPQRAVAS
jgi:type I restriction enzyme, S subunit